MEPRLELLARRYVWWRPPAEAVADERQFVAQVMAFGTWDDAHWLLARLGEAAFRRVLRDPPPGVLDAKAWTFWHLRLLGERPAQARPPGRVIPR